MNNEKNNEEHGHDKSIKIIVNGREKVVHKEVLTFEEIVALAFDTPPTANTIFTVSYRKAHQHPESGTLVPGQSVTVKNGTTLNVTATDKS